MSYSPWKNILLADEEQSCLWRRHLEHPDLKKTWKKKLYIIIKIFYICFIFRNPLSNKIRNTLKLINKIVCSTFKQKKKKSPKKIFWTKIWKKKYKIIKIMTKPSPWQAQQSIVYKGIHEFSKKKKKTNTEQITKSKITSKSKIT